MVSLVDQIAFLYPNVQCSSPLITGDYSVVDNGSGPRITHWNTAKLGPQPTEAQLAAVTPQQIEAARWQRLRAKAVEALSNHEQTNNAVIRAVVLELLAYANQERAKFNQLLQWLGSQTTLVNRGQLANLQLNEATPQQASTAIRNRIEQGEAD